MKIFNMEVPIVVCKLEEHAALKDSVINAIASMGKYSYITTKSSQKVSSTDWHLNASSRREYWEIIGPHILKICDDLSKSLGYMEARLLNYWFQWYEKGDFHGMHTHPGCMFSHVYYLQLAADNPRTTFLFNGQKFDVPVEEGDVLTFPNFLFHKSAVNESETPKIIISFNSIFDGCAYE